MQEQAWAAWGMYKKPAIKASDNEMVERTVLSSMKYRFLANPSVDSTGGQGYKIRLFLKELAQARSTLTMSAKQMGEVAEWSKAIPC